MSDFKPAIRFFFEEDGEWAPGVAVEFIYLATIPVVGDVLFGLNLGRIEGPMRVVARWFMQDVNPTWWLLVEPATGPDHRAVLALQREVDQVFDEIRRGEEEERLRNLRAIVKPRRRKQ